MVQFSLGAIQRLPLWGLLKFVLYDFYHYFWFGVYLLRIKIQQWVALYLAFWEACLELKYNVTVDFTVFIKNVSSSTSHRKFCDYVIPWF